MKQEQNRSSSQFSQRTEKLAAKLGLLLRDLPDRMGISNRMFYGYRSGKYPVTAKALRKLDQAESEAGFLNEADARIAESATYPNYREIEKSPMLQETSEPGHEARIARLEKQLADVKSVLSGMLWRESKRDAPKSD